jgi:hypothetical protein
LRGERRQALHLLLCNPTCRWRKPRLGRLWLRRRTGTVPVCLWHQYGHRPGCRAPATRLSWTTPTPLLSPSHRRECSRFSSAMHASKRRILARIWSSVWQSSCCNQSFPVNLNIDSVGRSHCSRIAWRRATAFMQATVAWKASLVSCPQMEHRQSTSNVLLHLFLFVASVSVATLQQRFWTWSIH